MKKKIAASLPDEKLPESGCPCLHTEPCCTSCTCRNPYSSVGCRRCCRYGSKEQQAAKARHIARALHEYESQRS